ncbi:hypothetical protein GWK47_026033 [Chionoecetes opilio]|uniref:Uncharacterized protein n=1 Tax=Chionoecetes opilio TaxID=41210 RepID=A0A8J8WNJ9_CHIOP|nr:hypothetical protein GWK47_026033 [Chionoecetes opilio]
MDPLSPKTPFRTISQEGGGTKNPHQGLPSDFKTEHVLEPSPVGRCRSNAIPMIFSPQVLSPTALRRFAKLVRPLAETGKPRSSSYPPRHPKGHPFPNDLPSPDWGKIAVQKRGQRGFRLESGDRQSFAVLDSGPGDAKRKPVIVDVWPQAFREQRPRRMFAAWMDNCRAPSKGQLLVSLSP